MTASYKQMKMYKSYFEEEIWCACCDSEVLLNNNLTQ